MSVVNPGSLTNQTPKVIKAMIKKKQLLITNLGWRLTQPHKKVDNLGED